MRILVSLVYFVFFLLSGQNPFYSNETNTILKTSKQDFSQKIKVKLFTEDSNSMFLDDSDTDDDTDNEEDSLEKDLKSDFSSKIVLQNLFLFSYWKTYCLKHSLGYTIFKFKQEIRSCFSPLFIQIRVFRI